MQPGRQCRQTQALRRAGQEIVVTSPAPGQVPDTGQEGKHEVELLFNLKADWCSASGAMAGVNVGLRHCWMSWRTARRRRRNTTRKPQHSVAALPSASPTAPAPRRPPPPYAPAPAWATHVEPTTFQIAAPSEPEVLAGAALAGKMVFYLWPAEGWVRGTMTRLCGSAAS